MRSTVRQIAERAQVSRNTVSNVLLGRHDIVAPDTRERVLQAARELEYVPVRTTLQNRHAPTFVIGVVLDQQAISRPNNVFTYEGLCEGARLHGYDLLTLLRANPHWVLDREELRYLDRRTDGFIFLNSPFKEAGQILTTLVEQEIPSVMCYSREVPPGVAWVDPDNDAALQQAVEHLLERGHQRLAYLTLPGDYVYDSVARVRAFGEATRRCGLGECADNVLYMGSYEEIGSEVISSIQEKGITAVICFNDSLALNLWDLLKQHKINVPDDISLIGMDNSPEGQLHGLTSLSFSFIEVGRLAVEAWVALLRGGDSLTHCKIAPVELICRKTVRVWESP